MSRSVNYTIFPSVKCPSSIEVEPYCIIGKPIEGKKTLIIGPKATIRSHTVIYAGSIIGREFTTGHHVMIREFCKIGNRVSIGTSSVIEHHVTIENNVRIHSNAFIPEYTHLKEGCWIGPCTCFTNVKYPNTPTSKKSLKGVVVEKGAIIGANVTLLPGVTIGERAIVGAGSVVTKDVAPRQVVAGNPASCIKEVQTV